MKSELRMLPHLAAVTCAVWLVATSSVVAQAPAPLPSDQILDHYRATPARKACFEFLGMRMRATG